MSPKQMNTEKLPRPVGFVLGGGASLGAVQVGMLQALFQAGLRPDFVVGTSVGALNGALLCERIDDAAERLSTLWMQMRRSDVFPGNLLSVVWRLRQTGTHLVDSAGLELLAQRSLTASTFENLQVPLVAVTVDLRYGGIHCADQGPLLPALLASSAIPGVFAPVPLNGTTLIDGGILANVPIAQALERGAKSIVVLDCTVPSPSDQVGDVEDIIARVTRVQQCAQLEQSLPAITTKVPVIYLDSPPPRQVSLFDFDQTHHLIDSSRTNTESQLRTLNVTGPGLYGDPFARYLGTKTLTTPRPPRQQVI